MNWLYSYTPDIWPALFVFAIIVYLSWYSWQRRSIPAAKPFAIGCLFGLLWTIGTILEISAVDPSAKIFWVKFQVAWFVPTGTVMPCFILVYAGLGRWLTRRNLILLFIPSLLFLGLILTNDYHHLVWTGFQLQEYAVPSPGLANRIFISYVYLLGLVIFAILVRLSIRSPQHRQPALTMLFGQIIGRGIYLLDYLNGGGLGPGETVLVLLGVTASAYGIALFHFHALDPIRLARSAVIDQVREGILVIDLNKRIVDLNSEAVRMLRNSEAHQLGYNIMDALPINSAQLDQIDKGSQTPFQISLGSDNDLRYYTLDITMLLDKHNYKLGHLLLLHDITDEKRAQTQILEQQQIMATLQERERLARELHDSTGQVLGYVSMQSETIRKWLAAGNIEKAVSLLTRLSEVAKDAHTDIRESILSLKAGSTENWSFLAALKKYLVDFQNIYGINTELIFKDGFNECNFNNDAEVQLLRVIQEAMTNARKHSGARNLSVEIDRVENYGRIIIKDDGIGFDPDHMNQDHDKHFGLVFMKERMDQIHGTVDIQSQPGSGTIVTLISPACDQLEGNNESPAG